MFLVNGFFYSTKFINEMCDKLTCQELLLGCCCEDLLQTIPLLVGYPYRLYRPDVSTKKNKKSISSTKTQLY